MSFPDWTETLFQTSIPSDATPFQVAGITLHRQNDIFCTSAMHSKTQEHTSQTFGFKWQKRDTFEGALSTKMRSWLLEKYGDVCSAGWFADHGEAPVLLDAGCGAGLSALELWRPALDRIRYVGVDISDAVAVARQRFRENGFDGLFIKADLQEIPLPGESADIIFSEGVLHHTDDTRQALESLLGYLKPGGRILFYVYKRKGPIREFTDDMLRDRLRAMSPDDAWDALMPLTRLGKILGDLDIEIDIPEQIDVIDIPSGKINLQRLFYWHIFKAFYDPAMSLDEMNHINFDWYTPANAHRQSPEEVRGWCKELGLVIEHEKIEPAGITVIARKEDAHG